MVWARARKSSRGPQVPGGMKIATDMGKASDISMEE